MLTCPACSGLGKRLPRSFTERVFNRAKMWCSNCGVVWYWPRVPFQKHTQCPECGTSRLLKLSKYDRIDRKSTSILRHLLGIFGAPIYHCTFCRLQFCDYRDPDPERKLEKLRKARART